MLLFGIFNSAFIVFENSQLNDLVKSKTRYVDEVFEQVKISKDVVYGTSVNEKSEVDTLKLDIYQPANDLIKNRPVIVWFHGGGFRYGNVKSQSYIVEMANRFARKGFVCVSADYRVREKPGDDYAGTIKDAVADGFKALQWVRENSNSLGIDKEKIVVGGGSAGGMLASTLCYNNREDGIKNEKSGIVAFVNLWGTPGSDRSVLNIDKNDPPTIIVHGTADQLVAYSNSVELVQKLDSAGVYNKLITLEGAGHTPAKQMNEYEPVIAGFLFQYIK